MLWCRVTVLYGEAGRANGTVMVKHGKVGWRFSKEMYWLDQVKHRFVTVWFCFVESCIGGVYIPTLSHKNI